MIIIALAGDQLVGLATITPTVDTKAGEIGVAVLKKYWRQGIGLELMLSALDWAAIESSYNEISLTVQKNNLGAVAFTKKSGLKRSRPAMLKTVLVSLLKPMKWPLHWNNLLH
ncbi:GNAT family N-acetyltransferase [Secundilactobacillus collinoides]|uniref:GNAT family N-acetyltransferase n=1 Tax=Secundilactobacillus collinoides TaxID=33960 RepID=UPI0006D284BB|nr:GNAT family N-acetyltransferase [Secundilactobacillus collinoides]